MLPPPEKPAAVSVVPAARPTALVDRVVLGDARSEQSHKLQAAQSDTTRGALGEPARKLLPGGGLPWEGGKVSITIKVDPAQQTYVTARFWGDEPNENYLLLFCQGKQVGYRHLGDVDVLALPDEEPRYNGRFYYVTTPLPREMTQGKHDETAGAVAIKNGQEILLVSLYWRAGFGVNCLARTHYLTPRYQQVAVVREEVKHDASGQTYKRRDWIKFGFGNGGTHIRYPADLHQAYAGEVLPIARMPAGVKFKPGDSKYFAGMGEFYGLRYGRYLIGMKTTQGKSFELQVPQDAGTVKDLASSPANVVAGSILKVGPRSTVILYMDGVTGR